MQSEAVFSLEYDGTTLWAGTRARLFQNSRGGWTSDSFFELFTKYDLNNSISEVRGLEPMPGGEVYLGIAEPVNERRGVHLQRFDGTDFNEFQFDAPPMNNLLRLSFDTDASLWVSSSAFGVGKLNPSGTWINYNTGSGDTNLNSRFVNLAFLADRNGSKWFGTLSLPTSPVPMNELQDGGDDDPGNDIWIDHDIDSGGGDALGSLRGIRAVEDPAGNRWFLSDDAFTPDGWWGINILAEDRSEWRRVNPNTTGAQGMLSGNVTDAAFWAEGQAFVALRNFGVQTWILGDFDKDNLFDFSGDGWTVLGQIGVEFDSEAEILAVTYRSDGSVWVGTTVGAYLWDVETLRFRHITANRGFGVGLLGNVVRDIVLDREENAWLATDLGFEPH